MKVFKKNEKAYKLYLMAAESFRELEPGDAGKLRVPVLVLDSNGVGEWETFHGSHIEEADIGQVGGTFADVYLLSSHKAVRFKHSKKKIMIRRER